LEIFLMVQFVAVVGALLFERLAYLIRTKNAIIVSLVIWSAVVIYAYQFLNTVPEAWIMAGVIALVLLANDPEGRRSRLLWTLRSFGTRHVVDGTTAVQHRDRAHRFVQAGAAVVSFLLYRGTRAAVDHRHR